MGQLYTTKELADLLEIEQWKVRRAVDGIKPKVPRAGQTRLVSAELIEQVQMNAAKILPRKKKR
jgi:hypothetical protein